MVVVVWESDLQLPVQSVPIVTTFVRSNLADDEVYSIKYNLIKFVSDGYFLRELRFPPQIKLTATI